MTLKLIFVLCACLVFPAAMFAQSFQGSAKAEQTVKGTNYEMGAAYEWKNHFIIGGFYQRSHLGQDNELGEMAMQFYGMSCQIPCFASDKFLFSAVLRGGLVNNKFLVVTPAVETRVMVFPRTGLTATTGFRHGYPSAALGIVYKFTLPR